MSLDRAESAGDMGATEPIGATTTEGWLPPLGDPYEELALVANALEHPDRVRILHLLLNREECVCGEMICGELPQAQPCNLSQHLSVLSEAGLIRGEIDGPRVRYRADLMRLHHFRELLDTLTATFGR